MRNAAVPEDIRGKCTALLQLYDASHSEWQLGKTKVRLRTGRSPGGGTWGLVVERLPSAQITILGP